MAGAPPLKLAPQTPREAAGALVVDASQAGDFGGVTGAVVGAPRAMSGPALKASDRPATRGGRLWQNLMQVFTWWSGQTIGTRFHTWRNGELVGHDEFGNAYYQTRGGAKDPALGFTRRWVIYVGEAEASNIPPGWYGWLQHRQVVPPSGMVYIARPWEKLHKPNMTGTPDAYRPAGSVTLPKDTPGLENPRVDDAYEAWSPK